MRRFFVPLLALVFILSWGEYSFARPVKGKVKKQVAAAKQTAEEPCKAFIVMEATTGKVLEGDNIHTKRPPASVTKLMLTYIVMEKLTKGEIHLTDTISVTKAASKIGGSQVFLAEGETFSLEDMMRATLVASANDAAYAIAEALAGSAADFVELMNEKAKALNMADTEYHSVHGLPPSKDQKEDLTSCYDLALLARELLKYPKALEWTSTKSGPFRDGKFGLNNTNKLLTKMVEVDGLKTGYYRSSGFNVVATAKKGDLRFIVVVMGSPSGKVRDSFAMEKFRKYFSEYTAVGLAKKGDPVDKEVVLEDGKYRKLKGVVASDFTFPVLKGRKKEVKKVANLPASVKGEVKEGQKLGEMVFQLDNEVIGKVDIVSPVYVPKANLFTRMIRKVGLNL